MDSESYVLLQKKKLVKMGRREQHPLLTLVCILLQSLESLEKLEKKKTGATG
jgi:hypothetical protein